MTCKFVLNTAVSEDEQGRSGVREFLYELAFVCEGQDKEEQMERDGF